MQRHLLVLIGLLTMAIGGVITIEHTEMWQALAQGAGPIGRPGLGGNLPQDLDTISTIVPSTTQTQAGAIAGAKSVCLTSICWVPVANSGDVMALRQCTIAPMRQTVINDSGNSIQVFGSGTDTINDIATATGIAAPAVTSTAKVGSVEYTCTVGGAAAKWYSH